MNVYHQWIPNMFPIVTFLQFYQENYKQIIFLFFPHHYPIISPKKTDPKPSQKPPNYFIPSPIFPTIYLLIQKQIIQLTKPIMKTSNNFNQQQQGQFKQAFSLFDKDGDGSITAKQLASMMRSLGQNPSDAQLKQMMAENDTSKKGKITFNQFLKLMDKKMKDTDVQESELMDAFKIFDRNGNGLIEASELRHVMINLGEKLTEEEVEDMIRQADIYNDGKIKYQEFVKKLMEK